MSARPRVLAEELLHPVALGAVATLVLNDHFLKRLYPGLLTGKLSDAAGMLFFPLFLHALVELSCGSVSAPLRPTTRAWQVSSVLATVVTALGFALVKTLPAAAELYRTTLGSVHCLPSVLGGANPLDCRVRLVRDASDLVVLPLVLVPAWLLLRAAQLKSMPASQPSDMASTPSLK